MPENPYESPEAEPSPASGVARRTYPPRLVSTVAMFLLCLIVIGIAIVAVVGLGAFALTLLIRYS